jgi:hypothetical protein
MREVHPDGKEEVRIRVFTEGEVDIPVTEGAGTGEDLGARFSRAHNGGYGNYGYTGYLRGESGDYGYTKKQKIMEVFSKNNNGASTRKIRNMEGDSGGLGMESDQGSFNSPQSVGTLHERGLGKGDTLHSLVDALGQGEYLEAQAHTRDH